jgi:hypothetical protein
VSQILKLIGKLARLLLAIEAHKWQEQPGIRIRPLAGGYDLPLNAKVVSPEKHDPPTVERGQPVVIPAEAGNVVITTTPPIEGGWRMTVRKALEQVIVLLWAFMVWAFVYALDGVLAGGVLEKMNLPEWVSLPMVYSLVNVLREEIRKRQAAKGKP